MEVLFVCRVNLNRSQIAAAIFNKLSKKNHAVSAGMSLNPELEGTSVVGPHNSPVEVLKEFGYDISKEKRKQITEHMVESAGKIVLIFSKQKYSGTLPKEIERFPNLEWWDIPSISDELPHDEYIKQERKRIIVIETLVKDLVKRVG